MSKTTEHLTGKGYINPYSVPAIWESLGKSDPSKIITNKTYGIDFTGYSMALPPQLSRQGFVFMTRPQLNMGKYNLRRNRKYLNLLNKNPKSIGSWIRNTLDPRLGRRMKENKAQNFFGETYDHNTCPLVDERNAFIPIITNSIKTVSGFPDKIVGKYVSQPNRFKSVYQQVDSVTNLKEPVTIDITAQNTTGDLIYHLLDVWSDYTMDVYQDNLQPYGDMELQNEKDYETRLFRIILDHSGRYLERISALYPGFNEGSSQGGFYDFNRDKPFIEGAKEISFRLSCPGIEYNDPILISSFNRIVVSFNRDMSSTHRNRVMTLVPDAGNAVGTNYRAYPRINPNTLAFEWWTYRNLDPINRSNQQSDVLITNTP